MNLFFQPEVYSLFENLFLALWIMTFDYYCQAFLREHPEDAEQRQWDIMNHNSAAAVRMIERVGTLPPERRMVRLGSEMLQGYTEANWKDWWQRKEIQDHCAKIFAPVGEASRKNDVKISFHPGQFCV